MEKNEFVGSDSASRSYVLDSGCLKLCEASLGKEVGHLRRSGWHQSQGREDPDDGVGARKPPQCVGHSMKGANEKYTSKRAGEKW